jgi:hypothetical protein
MLPRAKASQIRNTGALQSLRIRHKEYVADFKTGSTANEYIQQFEFNPGLDESLPWGSRIAGAFESYRFNMLRIHFVTGLGTDNDGSIALVPDYDASDDNSTQDKKKLFSYADTVRGPVWKNITLNCRLQNLRKRKTLYVRDSNLSQNKDIKLYDALSYILVASGFTAEKYLGEIWVEYDITFFTPQLEPSIPEGALIQLKSLDTGLPFSNHEVLENEIGVKVQDDNQSLWFTEQGIWNLVARGRTSTGDVIQDINTPIIEGPGTMDVLKKFIATPGAPNQFGLDTIIETTKEVSALNPFKWKWGGPDIVGGPTSYVVEGIMPLLSISPVKIGSLTMKKLKDLRKQRKLEKEKELKTKLLKKQIDEDYKSLSELTK